MNSSFNAFGSVSNNYGQTHIPIWLGTVSPRPVGGVLASGFLKKGILIPAGSAINLASKVITPFVAWEVVSFAAAESPATEDTIVIKPAKFGDVEILPTTSDFIQKVGSTFAATGKAAAVASVTALTGDDAGKYSVKVLHSATVDSLSEGDYIALSSATAAGSSKSLAAQPNGYLYNDIYLGDLDASASDVSANTIAATGAVVDFHGEGILIDLAPCSMFKDAMKAAVPNVIQVTV